jgi:2-dehydropantoate 2-reductase
VRDPLGRERHYTVQASDQPADAGGVDLAQIQVNSYNNEGAAALARRILHPAGLALTLQNGLGNLEVLKAAVGPERAALGVTSLGATMIAPGLVQEGGAGPTYMATQPATAAQIAEAAQLFREAGFETTLLDDLDAVVWGKLAVNAAINPLTALLEVPNGFLADHEASRRLMALAAGEVAAVARAQGILLRGDPVARALEVAYSTASNRSSMLQDVERGAPTEIDAICGQVVRHGRRLGLSTDANEALFQLVNEKMAGHDWRGKTAELPPPLRALFMNLLAPEASL